MKIRNSTKIVAKAVAAVVAVAPSLGKAIPYTELYTLGFPSGLSGGSQFVQTSYQTNGGSQLVGSVSPPNSAPAHALVWSPTSPNGIDLHPVGFTSSTAYNTTGAKQVGVGYLTAAQDIYHAVLWSGTAGSAVDLNPTGFSKSLAFGAGGSQQAGYGITQAGGFTHALLWTGTANSFVDLHPSGFVHSSAVATNGIQQVGLAQNNSTYHAFLWNGTAASAIDLNPSGYSLSQALGTNGYQQVGVGTDNTGEHAFLWNGSAASAVNLSPAGYGGSRAIATDGSHQAGYAVTNGNYLHAMLWYGNAASAVDLNPSGYSFTQAVSIAGNTVYGYGRDGNGILKALSWTIPGGGNWLNTTNTNNSWSTSSNWANGGQPTSTDDASFGQNATYTVNLTAAGTAKTINVSAGNVAFNLGGNTLTVGTSTANESDVAFIAGQMASATFSGPGTLAHAGPLKVGEYGNGTLTINQGANANFGYWLATGGRVGSNSTINIDGAGTTVSVSNKLEAAYQGTGTINITNGAHVTTSTYVDLASQSGAVGTMTLSGSGTSLLSPSLYVGGEGSSGGSGTLNVGAVSSLTINGDSHIFNGSSSINLNGGSMNTGGYVFVGETGGGASLNISNASILTMTGSNTQLLIATSAGTSSSVTISGAGSKLLGPNVNRIGIGDLGTGTLTINNGATVSIGGNLVIGNQSGSTGTLNVSGSGTTVSANVLDLGNANSNTVNANFTNGATATFASDLWSSSGFGDTTNLTIGAISTSTATVNINGSAYLGGNSTNSFAAATLNLASNGVLNVAGTTKVWNSSSSINLTGGTLSTGSLDTGHTPSRFTWTGGTLNITNSTFLIDPTNGPLGDNFTIGNGMALNATNGNSISVHSVGNDYLKINSGGKLSATSLIFGDAPTTYGKAIISDANTTVTLGNVLQLGPQGGGNADVYILEGASVSVPNSTQLGVNAGKRGYLVVSSSTANHSKLTTFDLYFGGFRNGSNQDVVGGGYGEMYINSGADVVVAGATKLLTPASILYLNAGGSLKTRELKLGGVASKLAWGGGTLHITDGNVDASLTVPAGGTLKGNTYITGSLASSGTISPELNSGPGSISSTGSMSASGVLNMDVFWHGYNDSIGGNTNTLNGAQINVTTAGGYTGAPGATFQLLGSGNIAGTWSFNFTGAPLAPGLSWDTSSFASTGQIRIAGGGASAANWNVNANGNWGTNGNWSPSSPNGVGSVATFGNTITSPRTITVESTKYLQELDLNSAIKYTIAGPGTLKFEGSQLYGGQGATFIQILAGNHEISAPISTTGMIIDGNNGASLKLGNVTAAKVYNSSGSLEIDSGLVEIGHFNGIGLFAIRGFAKLTELTLPVTVADRFDYLSGGGQDGGVVDVTNHAMVIKQSTLQLLRNEIAEGMNGFDNNGQVRWDGTSMISSTARANNVALGVDVFTIGVISNRDLANLAADGGAVLPYDASNPWLGTVSDVGADDVLMRYTYAGDTNLDGIINIDDYNNIDGTFSGLLPTNYGWVSGDFDYNGVINIDDYNAIDTGFLYQGGQLTQSMIASRISMFGAEYVTHLEQVAAGFASVPEPAAIGIAASFSLGLLTRRRRSW